MSEKKYEVKLLDKIILWLLVTLNKWHLYRIKMNGAKSIDNPNSYEVLLPDVDTDKNSYYTNPLKVALQTPSTNNIAVTGPYGSGKSSFLRTFEEKNAEWVYLPISLATFKEMKSDDKKKGEASNPNNTEKDKFELHQDIERSILQQFFYREKDAKIPYSRFKRIRNIKKTLLVIHSFLMGLIVLYGFLIYSPEKFKKFFFINPLEFLESKYHKFISLVIVGIIFYYVYRLFKYLWNIQVSKFNFKRGEITLAKQEKSSILNEHLDEILYFFEVTKYNVIVFEDLDRFNDTEIFIKLRELNNLINNSKQIGRRVIFIYAIRDDMFVDKERTKFFDFIVPIIPYINPSNSYTKLKGKFENEIEKSNIDEGVIEDISLYIDDMRLLLNIYNEYMVYKNNLDSDSLNYNKLLALVVCKNFYPLDFAKLHFRDGIIYDLFANKSKYIKEKIHKYNDEKKIIINEKKKIENENLQSLNELHMLYSGAICELSGSIYFKINNQGQEYNISQLEGDDIFDRFGNDDRIYSYSKDQYNRAVSPKWINFKELGELVGKEYTYKDRKKIIEDKSNNKLNELKKELENIDKKINKLTTNTLKELFITSSVLIITDEYKDKDLLIFLVRNGYIDEDYEHYISYFHKGGITQDDREFLLSVKNIKSLEFSFKLGNIAKLVNKLKNKEFEQESILNFDLMTYLVSHSHLHSDKLNIYLNQLANESDISIKFIFDYLDYANNEQKSRFIKELKWDNVWNYIINNFSEDTQKEYFNLIFESLSIDSLTKLNSDSALKIYIEKQTMLPKYTDENNVKYQQLISNLEVEIENIENPLDNLPLFNYIYEHCHYILDEKMINIILDVKGGLESDIQKNLNTAHLTTVRQSEAKQLIEYINENINEYIENLFLVIETNIGESENIVISLLNNEDIDFENRVKIIQKEEIRISDISKVAYEKSIWFDIIKMDKIQANWENVIYNYIEVSELDENTINLLNREENYKILSKSKIKNEELFDKAILSRFNRELVLCRDIVDEAYEYLIKSIWYWKYRDLDIEGLSGKKIDYMLEENKLDLVQNNIDKLKEFFPDKHINLIENFKKEFLEKYDEYDIDGDDMLQLMNSLKFDKEEKFVIVVKMDLSLFDDKPLLRERVSKLYIDEKKELESIQLFETLFYGENQYDLELLISQIDYFEDCDKCKSYLVALDTPYVELLDKSAKLLYLEKNETNQLLLEKLKSKNCIGSFNDAKSPLKKNKIKVNRKRT